MQLGGLRLRTIQFTVAIEENNKGKKVKNRSITRKRKLGLETFFYAKSVTRRSARNVHPELSAAAKSRALIHRHPDRGGKS